MKKLIIITIALFLSANLFTSCTTDEGDNPDRLTSRGLTMTDEWSSVTDAVLRRYADITFKLNYYIKTGQYNHGMYETFMQSVDENIWEVYQYGEDDIAYMINTNGQALDSVGSIWELTSFTDYYNNLGLRQDDGTVNCIITCIDTNSWNIYSINNDLPEYFFDVNISYKSTPSTLYVYPYTFAGKGNLCINDNNYNYYYEAGKSDYSDDRHPGPDHYTYNEIVNLSFETEADLQKTPEYWSKGIVNIAVHNMEDETSSTRAEFLRKSTEYIVKITYGGVTEEWHPFNYWYY